LTVGGEEMRYNEYLDGIEGTLKGIRKCWEEMPESDMDLSDDEWLVKLINELTG
jgi:hypothetical protein